MDNPDVEVETSTSAKATLFDLRTVIAILFGVYGVLLLIIAWVDTTQAELDKAGGIHLNLWTGIAMLLATAVFLVWVRLSPPLTGHAEDVVHDDD